MLSFIELERLVAFADHGQLSTVSEVLNISQPSLTRSMQHLEDEFGVPLFERTKNRIVLNETGRKAVEHARNLLKSADYAVSDVRAFHKSLYVVNVTSSAPAPLWYIIPELTSELSGQSVQSSIKDTPSVLSDLEKGECSVAVLTEPVEGYISVPFLKESLSICVMPDHVLARKSEVSFSELNGHNFLLRSQLGFWYDLHKAKMPDSSFYIQTSDFEIDEIIKVSSLPCFVSDLSLLRRGIPEERIVIPISDPEAHVTFYLVFRDSPYASVFERIARNIRETTGFR